jgi:hypothetical protein
MHFGVALLVACLSCGGSGAANPPTTPSGTLSAPTGLTVGTVSLRNRTAALSWNASPGASSYVIEAGSSSGGTNLATITTPSASTSFTLIGHALGRSFVRVRARNDAGMSNTSNEVDFTLVDFQDFTEALFLGTGPLESTVAPGCVNLAPGNRGVLFGFARGSQVRVRVASMVSAINQQVIRELVTTIPDATVGKLNTTFEVSDDQNPTPRDHEIVIAHGDTISLCGNPDGCGPGPFFFSFALVRWAKFTYSPTISEVPAVHEIAHILGMCHVNGDLIGGRPNNSLMGTQANPPTSGPASHAPRLTLWDIEGLQAVYGSSLNPGAVRSDFVAAGLARQ